MPMAGYDFTYGTHFLLKGREYVVRREDQNDVEVYNTEHTRIETWSRHDLDGAWLKGELVFRVQQDKEILPGTSLDLQSIPDDLKGEALHRMQILEPLLDGTIPASQIKEYADGLVPKVSVATLYRWKKLWEKHKDIRYLVPRRRNRGPQIHRTHPDIMSLIERVLDDLAYKGEDHNDWALYGEFLLRLDELNTHRELDDKLDGISYVTFGRRKREILDRRRANRAIYGSHLAGLMEDGVQQNIIVTRPLERVELDWTPTDVLLIDPKTLLTKRGILLYAIDSFSSMPLGFKLTIGAPTAADVKECLLHCMTPKTYIKDEFPEVERVWIAYGRPRTLVVDNASVNDSYELEDVCRHLGIRLQFTKVGAGNQKPRIERGFRTLNQKWLHGSPGTTKSNPIQRARYDSEGNACISPQRFLQMAHVVITDLVAHEFNRGVGMSPHQKWIQGWNDNPHLRNPLPRSFEELQFLLITGHEKRKLQPIGVQVIGQDYNSPELMKLRSQLLKDGQSTEVTVRFTSSDMRQVFVLNPYTGTFITANGVGLTKKGLDPSLPVPHIALEQDMAERSNNRKTQRDPRARARTNRTLEKLEKEAKKEKRAVGKSLKENPDLTKPPAEWNTPEFNVSSRTWEIPPDADSIGEIEVDNDYHKKKATSRNKGTEYDKPVPPESSRASVSVEISEEDFEDMDVSFK